MKRTTTGIALLAATVLAAGCGDDDDEKAPTKAEYTKQANKICADFNEELVKDSEETFAGVETADDVTPEKSRKFFQVALPKFDDVVEDIDALESPEGDEDTVQAIVDAGKSDSKNIEDVQDDDKLVVALLLGDTATPEFDKKAEAYGLAECGAQN